MGFWHSLRINGFDVSFQLTGDATYEPIVFLKQPYLVQGVVSFGYRNKTTTTQLQNPTNINFELFADTLSTTKNAYEKLPNTKHCPRDVLKFNPPPQNKQCDRNSYRDLTTIHEYGMNVTFQNVSPNDFSSNFIILHTIIFSIYKQMIESRMAAACFDTFRLFCHIIIGKCGFI